MGKKARRLSLRQVNKALREASERALETVGYIIAVKEGWVVRINKDGTEEKIKKI